MALGSSPIHALFSRKTAHHTRKERKEKSCEPFSRVLAHDRVEGHHAMKKLYLVRTIILAGSLVLQLSTLCFHSRGAAGDVDLSFDPGFGVNGPVNAVVVQPDGKVIIGGEFSMVKGLA